MIGARVMGLWSNGNWYPGVVSQARERRGEPQYFVQFDDGDTAWLSAQQIQVQSAPGAAPRGVAPSLGARVMADWAEESWYPGVVARANDNATMFFIQFEDGDQKWLPAQQLRYAAAARSPQPSIAHSPQPVPVPQAAPTPHGAPAHAAHPPAPMAAPAPRAESELRCAYCNLRITRNDVSRCPECGARL